MEKLDQKFWDEKYKENQTGWDIGYVSTPLKSYIDSLKNKNIHILIPGAGNSYEAEYLLHNGFNNTFILDWSKNALNNFHTRVPRFPVNQLIENDFFKHVGKYDLILEQTFFCALDPKLRSQYAQKMFELLNPGGILAGVLFNDPLNQEHPPFGGNKDEYLGYFTPLYKIIHMEHCRNSIPPRADKELFIQLQKKLNN